MKETGRQINTKDLGHSSKKMDSCILVSIRMVYSTAQEKRSLKTGVALKANSLKDKKYPVHSNEPVAPTTKVSTRMGYSMVKVFTIGLMVVIMKGNGKTANLMG